jgi:uncharacterized membrane protein YfcA
MDWEYVIKIAVFTVGVTSMVKQMMSFIKSAWGKVLLTIATGSVGMALLAFLPKEVFMGIIGIAVAVVFYDTILKMMERVLKGSEK